ncbi:GNAT family N-acetyltransferase [Aquimarina sp. MMG016]|uniref:GNAT family N-acetyltransferase n=1 Tax=Aquimarina sp. MMG016 TaxID=2822690 RepID=UPI001B3A2925|nr:GNAT family N-acetyltransferase [Aquimarina sp. MMG016]MBQ4822184.1 GNAT family N-acetyltransferase [Aquimarina sp. MMG016]
MFQDKSISFRIANIKDLALLQYWDTQQHVIDSDPDDDWNWEYELKRFPEWREQLIAELNGRPIGFVQIIDPREEESHYWGTIPKNLRAIDIWIGEKDDLGKRYGTIMMNLAIERCFRNNDVTAILIDPLESNINAIRFYEKLGFRFVEKRSFGDSDCMVYKLKRKDWKQK